MSTIRGALVTLTTLIVVLVAPREAKAQSVWQACGAEIQVEWGCETIDISAQRRIFSVAYLDGTQFRYRPFLYSFTHAIEPADDVRLVWVRPVCLGIAKWWWPFFGQLFTRPVQQSCSDQCPDDPLKVAPGACGCGVADTDTDGDLTADCNDACPIDPAKIAAAVCGCGVADTDTDGDLTADCNDACPIDPGKIAAGVCGCGVADTDSDGDLTADCDDACPIDPGKTAAGVCGCGVADTDTDGDVAADCIDACPNDATKTEPLTCGCGIAELDTDLDARPDCVDGCPTDPAKVAPGLCGCGFVDGPGGTCDACQLGQVIDPVTGQCIDPGPLARIYQFDPPVVTEARLLAMASILGLQGAVTTDEDGVRMRSDNVGPVGPFQMFADQLEILVGFRLTVSVGPQCDDFIDNDGDGLIDLVDPECASGPDFSEDLAGVQGPSALPVLAGTQNAAGELIVTTSSFPPLTYTLPEGGVISGTPMLTGPGTGLVTPSTGAFAMTLPLRATLSCNGAGCFAGTCELDLGNVPFDNVSQPFYSAPYAASDGTVRMAAPIPIGRVVSCTDASPAEINTTLRLPAVFDLFRMDGRFTPPLARSVDALNIDEHGHVIYTTDAGAPDVARDLPDDATAEAITVELLTDLGLLPPNPIVELVRLEGSDGSDTELNVMVTPQLVILVDQGVPLLAPVRHGGVMVRLGTAGAVLGFHSQYLPVTFFTTRPLKDPDVALAQGVPEGTIPTVDANGDPILSFQPVYLLAEQAANETFLDPMFAVTATDDPDREFAHVAATGFTPKPTFIGVLPLELFDGSAPVPVSVSIVDGTPPFDVEISSDLDGLVGVGESADLVLSDGLHTLTAEVTDANGSRVEAHAAVEVVGSPEPAPPPDPNSTPIDGELTQRGSDGSFFSMTPRDKRVGPTVSMRNSSGWPVATVSFGQWRFKMTVSVNGQEFTLQSGKCRDLSQEGRQACDFPSGEGWVTVDSVTPMSYGAGTRIATGNVVFRNVPGTLSMTFKYFVGTKIYAGPTVGVGGTIGSAFAVPGFPLVPTVGEATPGVSPQVHWTFTPATEGFETEVCNGLNDIKREANELEGDPEEVGYLDVPQALLDSICDNGGGNGVTFSVVDIEVEMFTILEPTMGTHHTTLVRDNVFPSVNLLDHDGTLDRSKQPLSFLSPLLGINDTFVEINPMGGERSVIVAQATSAGAEFDNFHAKGMPSIRKVTYPGCNSPFLMERPKDWRPCLHMHERWFEWEPYDKGQDVTWHIGRFDGRRDPDERPDKFIDGGGLNVGPDGTNTAVWIQAKGKATDCFPAGGVNNSGRPCVMFKAPFFGTH